MRAAVGYVVQGVRGHVVVGVFAGERPLCVQGARLGGPSSGGRCERRVHRKRNDVRG